MNDADQWGLFGKGGEYRPRFGLWLNDSPECIEAVRGLLSEGFDCDVVFKFGSRCWKHAKKSFRPVIALSDYAAIYLNSKPFTGEIEACDLFEWMEDDGTGLRAVLRPGCYVREVYFPERFNLRRRGALSLQ